MMDFDEVDHIINKRDELAQTLIEKLKLSEDTRERNLAIYKGFEVYASQEILETAQLKKLTLNGSRYILVEFHPNLRYISFVVDCVEEISRQGLIMIMAHPERYQFTQKDNGFVNYLLDEGVLFQINADSITGNWGSRAQRLACDMLDQNMVHFIASDAHNTMRNNNMSSALNEISRFIPDLQIDDIVHKNAKAVIADRMIQEMQRGML